MKRLVRTRMLGVVRGARVTGPLSRSDCSSFDYTSGETYQFLRYVDCESRDQGVFREYV